MGGLIYLIVFSALFYGLHHAGKWLGSKLLQLSPRKKWAFKLVNYPKWKIMLSGCLLFVLLTCGDEIYSKFRIELMCHDVKKTLPVIDKNKISNREIKRIISKAEIQKYFFTTIIELNYSYYDVNTEEFLFEYARYHFSGGWLTNLAQHVLFTNGYIYSIPYPEKGNSCNPNPFNLQNIDLKTLNSKIVDSN